jgi:hypothetical protein
MLAFVNDNKTCVSLSNGLIRKNNVEAIRLMPVIQIQLRIELFFNPDYALEMLKRLRACIYVFLISTKQALSRGKPN